MVLVMEVANSGGFQYKDGKTAGYKFMNRSGSDFAATAYNNKIFHD